MKKLMKMENLPMVLMMIISILNLKRMLRILILNMKGMMTLTQTQTQNSQWEKWKLILVQVHLTWLLFL